jgi:hypothetical protein
MKRRTIMMTPAAAVVASSGVGAQVRGPRNNRYGTAGSSSRELAVQRLAIARLTLNLSRAGLSLEAMAPAAAILSATSDLLGSDSVRQDFRVDPARFLASYGVGVKDLPGGPDVSVDVSVLRALISNDALAAVESGSVSAVLGTLEQLGAITQGRSVSDLSENLARLMMLNAQEVAPIINHLLRRLEAEVAPDLQGFEYQVLAGMLRDARTAPECSVITVACLAWIAASAYTYVLVVAAVTVAVTVAVAVGVFCCTDPNAEPGPGYLLSKFAPNEVQRYSIAVRVANARGRRDVAHKILSELFRVEVLLVIDALVQSGHFAFSPEQRRAVEQGLLLYLGSTLPR